MVHDSRYQCLSYLNKKKYSDRNILFACFASQESVIDMAYTNGIYI